MQTSTSDQIRRTLELSAAATPGPWGAGPATFGNPSDGPTAFAITTETANERVASIDDYSKGAETDAYLIAEYRTLGPLLARKLERAMETLQIYAEMRGVFSLAALTLDKIEEMEEMR